MRRAHRPVVSNGSETKPPASGEVDPPQLVIVCSTRVVLDGKGDAMIARDAAELLIAVEEAPRAVVVVDVASSSVEMAFLLALASDFPTTVSVIVEGDPAIDRQKFHAYGVYRAQFEPAPSGLFSSTGDGTVDRGELVARVALKLARSPTPIANLKRA